MTSSGLNFPVGPGAPAGAIVHVPRVAGAPGGQSSKDLCLPRVLCVEFLLPETGSRQFCITLLMVEQIAPLLGRTLILVSHPDDETMAAGALMQRVRQPMVVFATDGAPRDRYFWEKFGSREAYADARRQEAHRAMAIAGVRSVHFLADPADRTRFVDQHLFLWIPEALEQLDRIVAAARPDAVLTHAYEGGHPDHDTCSFIGTVLARRHQLPLWEFPLYHRSTDGVIVRQEFMVPIGTEVLLDITLAELERKKRMMDAHASQSLTLSEFSPAIERFRPMFDYDFSRPPHVGTLNYEAWQWSVTGSQIVGAFQCWQGCRKPEEINSSEPGVRTVA